MRVPENISPSGRDGSDLQAGYSRLQIGLHWLVVVLFLVQWLTYDAILRTHGSFLPPKRIDLIEHAIHVYSGITIGMAMVLRLFLRWWQGVPRPIATGGTTALARIVYAGLYAALLAQAATGFVTTYLWGGAGRIHVLLWNVVLALIALHVAGAILHIVRGDGALGRIMPFRARR